MQNDYERVFEGGRFSILKKDKEYYICTFEKGIPLAEINEQILIFNIEITNFINLRNAVTSRFNEILPFGQEKDKILITISIDDMKAFVNFDLSKDELIDKFKIKERVAVLLAKEGVVYGVNINVLDGFEQIPSHKNILVAEGIEPVKGEDSIVKVINIKEVKPKELEDGRVDHHDMGIINLIKTGDWLGEWTLPTDGIPGINVRGVQVLPIPGKLKTVSFDNKTIKEIEEAGKMVLYSIKNGAVAFEKSGTLTVSNYLVIDDVNYKTGNIDFDGFVTINGSISDNFSVIATEDIEIKGGDGIGGVTQVISKNGNILVAGGINGKGRAVIKGFNITSKFISNATIVAKNRLSVTKYIINSKVDSREVSLEGRESQIAGGEISNITKLSVETLGNTSEIRTIINLNEINREEMSRTLQELTDNIEINKTTIYKIEKILTDNKVLPDKAGGLISQKFELISKNSHLEKEFNELKQFLSLKGDAQINIFDAVLPGVKIVSKKEEKIFEKKTRLSCIYSLNGIMHFE